MKNKIIIWTIVFIGLIIIFLKGKDYFRSILVNKFKKKLENTIAMDEELKAKYQKTLEQIQEVEKKLNLVDIQIKEVETSNDEDWHLKRNKK